MAVAITLLLVALVVGVCVLIWHLDTQRARKRTAAMMAAADGLGFEFHPQGDPALLARVTHFGLGAPGRVSRLTNLLRGTAKGLEVALFDFDYTLGHAADPGQQLPGAAQTVVAIRAPDLDIPAFILSPQRFWHRLGAALGMQDLNFETHPVFSRKYVLRAADEAAVRRLFDVPTLDHFERTAELSVEGAGDTFLVYCEGQRLDTKDLPAALEQAFGTLAVLRKPATAG